MSYTRLSPFFPCMVSPILPCTFTSILPNSTSFYPEIFPFSFIQKKFFKKEKKNQFFVSYDGMSANQGNYKPQQAQANDNCELSL